MKCKKDFQENQIEESHDLPKYLGGTDKDGRHWLCKKCHDKYERMILMRCFILVYKELIFLTESRKSLIPYMEKIKKEKNAFKKFRFLDAVKKTKKEFFKK